MKWMAIAVLIWAVSAAGGPPPVIQVPVETEALCKEAVRALARDLGKAAAAKSFGEPARKHNLVLTSCVRIAN